jgi:acetylornithine deacetylase/succinyl-diaminopimelate desuccinylase-like protein
VRTKVLIPLALLALAPMLSAQTSSADYKEPYQRQALEIFRTLIGHRSAEGHGKVPEVARYLAEQFKAGGFPASDVHVLPVALPGGEETAVLIVRYRGEPSSKARPILFTAHMDVVDALPKDWKRDPFKLTEENGYFYGRGILDDKFGVTTLTTTFLRLKQSGYVPNRDLIIAFSGDEETGMLSTRALVTTHRALTDAEFALNADGGGGVLNEAGEPERYLVQTSEKTYATFELTVTNPGGHSSTPRTDNAIYQLASVLKRIEAHRFPVQVNEATRAYFEAVSKLSPGKVGDAMGRLALDPSDAAAAEVLWHEPEHVGITRTTCVATMLRAGHAENALPQSATATVNCRIFPGVTVAEVGETLMRAGGDPNVQMVVLDDPKASPASPIRDDVMDAVAQGVAKIRPGTTIIPYMAPYGTDGKEIRAAGIPTYGIMGVFMKDSDQFAHGLDERVPVRSFFDALEFWNTVIRRLSWTAVP